MINCAGILRRPSSDPGRPELLSNTLRTMTKKFSSSAKVWLAAHEAALAGMAGKSHFHYNQIFPQMKLKRCNDYVSRLLLQNW